MIRALKFIVNFFPWVVMLCVSPYLLLPTSYWLQFNYVRVADSTPGVPPAMTVSRTIFQPVTARWKVNVRQAVTRDGKSGFASTCTAEGISYYIVDAIFPEKLDLDWWTWPTHCSLNEGQYIITTIWTINILGFWPRDIVIASNVFTVKMAVQD